MAPPGSNKRMGAKAGFMPRFCHHDTRGPPSIFLAQKTGTIADFPIRYRGGAYHAQAKPKAYTVTELQTIDAKAAADFAKRISEVQTKAGGRNFRTGGGKVVGLEGPPPPQRVAITEWDSLEKAEAFWKSKDWTALGPERDKALKTIRRYAVEAVQ
jgi:uncharacterized protein (DUF1330 family)